MGTKVVASWPPKLQPPGTLTAQTPTAWNADSSCQFNLTSLISNIFWLRETKIVRQQKRRLDIYNFTVVSNMQKALGSIYLSNPGEIKTGLTKIIDLSCSALWWLSATPRQANNGIKEKRNSFQRFFSLSKYKICIIHISYSMFL